MLYLRICSDNSEVLIGRNQFNQRWELLVNELNGMGPPVYSALVWRRKWAVLKYNEKKKRKNALAGSQLHSVKDQSAASQSHSVHVQSGNQQILDELSKIRHMKIETMNFLSTMSAQQSDIIEKLNVILNIQDATEEQQNDE